MQRIGLTEFRRHLQSVVNRAARGERFMVMRCKERVAVLGPAEDDCEKSVLPEVGIMGKSFEEVRKEHVHNLRNFEEVAIFGHPLKK